MPQQASQGSKIEYSYALRYSHSGLNPFWAPLPVMWAARSRAIRRTKVPYFFLTGVGLNHLEPEKMEAEGMELLCENGGCFTEKRRNTGGMAILDTTNNACICYMYTFINAYMYTGAICIYLYIYMCV